MSSLHIPATLAAVIAITAGIASSDVDAAGDTPLPGGQSIDVSAAIGGRWADPSGIYENPCAAPLEFDSHRLADDVGARALTRVRADGVVEKLWQTSCVDPTTGLQDPATIREFWVADPEPDDIVRAVFDHVDDYLNPPDVTWPNMSPEHGWLFVKVPMDFRVTNLTPITVTATVTNALGTATGSVTATPAQLQFASGEGGGATCNAVEAQQPYLPSSPGACAYEYANSSAIVGGEFATRTTMQWDVTSDPSEPSIPPSLDTFTTQSLAVSEVQAVVTCTGSGC